MSELEECHPFNLRRKMLEHAAQQSTCPNSPGGDCCKGTRLPKMTIRFAIVRGTAASHRLSADSELSVDVGHVWLTRIFSPYEYRVQPGDVIRLRRGERIWLNTDRDVYAEIRLTSTFVEDRRMVREWIARICGGMLRSVFGE
ncbi:DUF2917 domain-containing protein [Caballeronia sp. 15711]|uniref:DUF2917 domain-containing protein n=1 Tax=Caballeronia sp. 15711 TaxID=3391029 RepID=UPI0039E54475